MNVVICDDEQLYINSIASKVSSWAQENGHQHSVCVRSFSSSEDLLDAWENGLPMDMLFIDIQIPKELSGLDLAAAIRKSDQNVPIAFITGYPNYAFDGYLVNAIRYIMKPFDERPIYDCLNIAWSRWTLSQGNRLQIMTKQHRYVLSISKIMYIEVQGREVRFYTSDFGCIKINGRLSDYEKSLPSSTFGKCHKSFVANIMFVHKLGANCVTMADGAHLPLGRKFANEFNKLFTRYYFPK